MPAGYSGTPLARKLSLKDGMRVWWDGMPEPVRDEIAREGLALQLLERPQVPIDAAHIFVTARADMAAKLAALRPLLAPGGFIWVSWPKKASRVPTDISEDGIREIILPDTDLVDVKVCAIDAIREHEVRRAARDGAACPSSAYRAFDCKPRCGQCLPFAREIIAAERATA